VLCHRDYHSRNLMLHEGSLYIIDFQDARMGPDTTTWCRCCAIRMWTSPTSRSRS
jgi:aminoglycoside/choline kinase family phosphotransferase